MYASERLKKVGSKTVRNEIVLLKQMFKHALNGDTLKIIKLNMQPDQE